jgi:hypothetical protein
MRPDMLKFLTLHQLSPATIVMPEDMSDVITVTDNDRFVVAVAMALVTLGCIMVEEDTERIVYFVMDLAENGVTFVMGTVKLDVVIVIVKVS